MTERSPSRLPFVNPHPQQRTGEQGFALLFMLLAIGVIGTLILSYELGRARDARYQTYFSLGQTYAHLAKISHTYAQDIAYYDPYVHGTSIENAQFAAYFESIRTSRVAAFKTALIDVHDGVTANNQAQFTLLDMQKHFPGSYYGYVDATVSLTKPIRGVKYDFYGYGGLLPLRTVKQMQGASALVVLYSRSTSGPDIRTTADMAAFRAGAVSAGLARIGIVLPSGQRSGLRCHGQPTLVAWGNTDADCLTANEAGSLGMNLQPFDVVAPAWEAAEKNLVRNVIYRRPQPGIQDSNIMYEEIKMDGLRGDGLSNENSIQDASEVFTDTLNVDLKSRTDSALKVGDQTAGAPVKDAQLIVGRANNKFYGGTPAKWVCNKMLPDENTLPVGACISKEVKIEGDMAVTFAEDKDINGSTYVRTVAPKTVMDVAGAVEIKNGNVTVTADDKINPVTGKTKGFFDVTGGPLGGGTAKFQINGQASGGNGTIINKTVKVDQYHIKPTGTNETFVVDDEIAINGGDIVIGNAAQPSQVVFTKAPIKDVSLSTVGKGANAGVYGGNVDVNTLEQAGSNPLTFSKVDFEPDDGGAMKLNVAKNVVVDQGTGAKHKDNDCVGVACPDYVTDLPTAVPLR